LTTASPRADNRGVIEEGSVGIVETRYFTFAEPPNEMELECGRKLGPITLAYETYGELNEAKDNTILVLHALSGDAHVAGRHKPDDRKPGWWDDMVGPGRAMDTNKYFVVCSNVIGGCKGSTGPNSIDPTTSREYGRSFPVVTIRDMVNAQKALIDHLGIERLLCVIGGSMGGMQVLEWACSYPDMVRLAIPLATTAQLSPQGIAFDWVGRDAIMSNPEYMDGDYYRKSSSGRGLSLARMIGHITYLSEESMMRKFGRRLQNKEKDEYAYDFRTEFEVESYLDYQGESFVERFDANSYLYITKAMDYFDMERQYGSLEKAFARARAKFLVISFSSDWLFPSSESKKIVKALRGNNLDAIYMEIETAYGHDAFLVEWERLTASVSNFLRHGYANT